MNACSLRPFSKRKIACVQTKSSNPRHGKSACRSVISERLRGSTGVEAESPKPGLSAIGTRESEQTGTKFFYLNCNFRPWPSVTAPVREAAALRAEAHPTKEAKMRKILLAIAALGLTVTTASAFPYWSWRAVPLYLVPLSGDNYAPGHGDNGAGTILVNHTAVEYGGIEFAGLKPVCRPAPFFGQGYQLCTASGAAPQGVDENKHPWNRLARDFSGIHDQRPQVQLAGGWRFCPYTDFVGDGYGIPC
jgi:hypothetical protein